MCKYHLFLFVLFLSLIIFVGCNPDNAVGTGTLVLNIGSEVSRGLQAISMETASYSVEIDDASGKSVWTNSGSKSLTLSYSIELPAGTYTVKVDAANKSGQIIGNGSASVTVQAGKSSSCSVSVVEIRGNGNFQFSIAGPKGFSIEYTITSTGGENYSGAIGYSESSGAYVTTVELPNGFYEYSVSISGFDKPLKVDAVRIITDQTVIYRAEFTADGSGKIVIVNDITATPSVDIAFSSDRVKEDGSLL